MFLGGFFGSEVARSRLTRGRSERGIPGRIRRGHLEDGGPLEAFQRFGWMVWKTIWVVFEKIAGRCWATVRDFLQVLCLFGKENPIPEEWDLMEALRWSSEAEKA